jgi:hypothetical protein
MLVNSLFLFIGAFATWRITGGADRTARMLTVVFTLLSYLVIRSAIRPLPEAVFFGISLTAVAEMSVAATHSTRRFWHLTAAICLTAIAIFFRYAGAALLPALLWCIWTTCTRNFDGNARKRFAIVACSAVLLAVVGVMSTVYGRGTLAEYVRTSLLRYSAPLGPRILLRIVKTAKRLGDLALNLPVDTFTLFRPLAIVIGVGVAAFLFWCARVTRLPTAAAIYLATYLIMLAVWPFDTSRLWVPVVPFLLALSVQSLSRLRFTWWEGGMQRRGYWQSVTRPMSLTRAEIFRTCTVFGAACRLTCRAGKARE